MENKKIKNYPYKVYKIKDFLYGILDTKTGKLITRSGNVEGEKDKPLYFKSFKKAMETVAEINKARAFKKENTSLEKQSNVSDKKQKYMIHVTQTIEQDYEIEASSPEEAKEIAENKYMDHVIDPLNDEGDIDHEIRLSNGDNEKNTAKVFNLIGKVRDEINCLKQQNILVTDLIVVQSLDWLEDEVDEIDKDFIKAHEPEIVNMARTNYLKADIGTYFDKPDTAVCAAYLAHKVVEGTEYDPWDAIDAMNGRLSILDGSDENPLACLHNCDKEELLNEIKNVKELSKGMAK